LVQAPGFYEKLAAATQKLTEGLSTAARKHGVAFSAQAVGGMFGIYFRQTSPQGYAEVIQCDQTLFNRFFHAMLQKGVYFAPSAFEAGFVSAAHGEKEIAATLVAAEQVFSGL
jgi:glutamate-1-semialdehyde 2,1-aminomutase